MLGQHYDILFNYINHLTSIHSREESPDEGTPREMLFEVAMTEAIKNGEPDNEETELKAEKLVEFLWENYGD